MTRSFELRVPSGVTASCSLQVANSETQTSTLNQADAFGGSSAQRFDANRSGITSAEKRVHPVPKYGPVKLHFLGEDTTEMEEATRTITCHTSVYCVRPIISIRVHICAQMY